MVAIPTGLSEAEYQRGGLQHFMIEEFLLTCQQTAAFCGMRWLSPFVGWAADGLVNPALDSIAATYASRLANLVSTLAGADA